MFVDELLCSVRGIGASPAAYFLHPANYARVVGVQVRTREQSTRVQLCGAVTASRCWLRLPLQRLGAVDRGVGTQVLALEGTGSRLCMPGRTHMTGRRRVPTTWCAAGARLRSKSQRWPRSCAACTNCASPTGICAQWCASRPRAGCTRKSDRVLWSRVPLRLQPAPCEG